MRQCFFYLDSTTSAYMYAIIAVVDNAFLQQHKIKRRLVRAEMSQKAVYSKL